MHKVQYYIFCIEATRIATTTALATKVKTGVCRSEKILLCASSSFVGKVTGIMLYMLPWQPLTFTDTTRSSSLYVCWKGESSMTFWKKERGSDMTILYKGKRKWHDHFGRKKEEKRDHVLTKERRRNGHDILEEGKRKKWHDILDERKRETWMILWAKEKGKKVTWHFERRKKVKMREIGAY